MVMVSYVIKSAVFLSVMYVPYMLLLRQESFFRFNRLVLLSILLLSLFLPLCNVHILAWEENPVNLPLQEYEPVLFPATTAEVAPSVDVKESVNLLLYLYIIGVLFTFILKLAQLMRLYRMIHRGVLWTDRMDGATIYCHVSDVQPFSWFHSIVISESDYHHYATPILRHEFGHILGRHSLDILLLNVVQVVQWMNPFVWVLGVSLRDVHEYEADAYVLQSGVNVSQYQNLIIKKAIGPSFKAFANGFNHCLLKNRIAMMLQKKSNPWMRSKALYILPVAVLALSAFATPESADSQIAPEGIAPARIPDKMTTPQPEDPIFDIVEQLPMYPDGQEAMWKYMIQNLKYPQAAIDEGIDGRVIMQFVVRKDGRLTDFKALRGADDICRDRIREKESKTGKSLSEQEKAKIRKAAEAMEQEAYRVVKAMPNWIPGKQQGKAVHSRFVVPVSFRLV